MKGLAVSSGIYQITNQINGKCYIGSAVNLQNRRAVHLCRLRRGRHHNQHLQRAFDKYGEEAFMFSVLEGVEDVSQLIPREQHFIDTLNPEYNIAPIAGSSLGCARSAEARAKNSEAHIGKHHSEEARAKISAAKKGERNPNFGKHQHPSEKTRKKISAAKMGHPVSEETRAKIAAAQSGERSYIFGKHLSEETRAKISATKMGRRTSQETRRKMSEAHIGKHFSEKTRKRMSEAHKMWWMQEKGRAAKERGREP